MYNSRQQTDRASWTITSSSSTVNDSSLPTAGHSVIRGYGQYITRPVTCQPVSTTSCLHDSVAVRLHHVTRPAAAAAAAAVEWTSHAGCSWMDVARSLSAVDTGDFHGLHAQQLAANVPCRSKLQAVSWSSVIVPCRPGSQRRLCCLRVYTR